MHYHFRQPNDSELWNTDDGAKSLDFGRTALRFPVEMVCRGEPVASPVLRPLGFLPFLDQSGHAYQGMIFVFQPRQLLVLKLHQLAAHEPIIGFTVWCALANFE